MTTRVDVVIVSYNTRGMLERCLKSVAEATSNVNAQIVVVDNDSHDGSADAARKMIPDAIVLVQSSNRGFAAACNIGADSSTGSHILFLNPDTEMRPGCVEALLDCLDRHPESGVVGGRTVRQDGSLDPHSCWGQPSLWSMLCFASGLSAAFTQSLLFDPESLGRWPRDTERTVGVVTGCLLMCTRQVWNRIGGMSEAYFVYGEDVEFSRRAINLGYAPRITPKAEIMHASGAASASSSAKWNLMLRGKVTFMRRNWSPRRARLGVAMLVFGAGLRAAAARLHVPVAGPWRENWANRQLWIGGWEANTVAALPSSTHEAPARKATDG